MIDTPEDIRDCRKQIA